MRIQHFAITGADGSLTVMQFIVDDGRGVQQDPTDLPTVLATVHKVLWTREQLPLARIRAIELADLPADRTMRAAWVDTGTAIVVDPTRVRKPSLWSRIRGNL